MRVFWGLDGLVIVLLALGWLLTGTAALGWLAVAGIALGVLAFVIGFIQRGNAPDDKFPWE